MSREEFYALVEEAIEGEPGSVSEGMVLADMDGWDSMSVLSFMALVDERMGVALAGKQIANCITVDDLMALLGDSVLA